MDSENMSPKQTENTKFSMAGAGAGGEEAVYTNKKAEFQRLKEDLEERQATIVEVYSYLRELHGRLAGAEVAPPALKLLDVSGWAASELRRFGCGAGGGGEVPTPIGDGLETPKKIMELPAQLIGFCHEVLMKRNGIIDFLQETGGKNELGESYFTCKKQEWKMESDALNNLLATIMQQTESSATSVANKVSELVHQAMEVSSRCGQLKEQCGQLKAQLTAAEKQLAARPSATRALSSARVPPPPAIDGLKKAEGDPSQEVTLKRQYDLDLRVYRTRIRDLERDYRELENKFTSQSATVAGAESQTKQRELHHENRLRIMRESVRTAEQSMSEIKNERDSLMSKVEEFKALLDRTKEDGSSATSGLRDQVGELQARLAEERAVHEATVRQVEEMAVKMKLLENKSRCILELVQKKDFSKQRSEEGMLKESARLGTMLSAAELQLKSLKQENTDFTREISTLTDAKNKAEKDLLLKESKINELSIELTAVKEELKARKEKSSYYEKQGGAKGSSATHEQQIMEANKFIAAKIEEVQQLKLAVASKQKEISSLTEVVALMEVHTNKFQRRRIQYEKRIAALEQEVESLKAAQKRYPENWSDGILSQLSGEIPHLRKAQHSYAPPEYAGGPLFPQQGSLHHGDILASVSELIAQERAHGGPQEMCSEASESAERPRGPAQVPVVTILRPYRRVCLTPEVGLQPISSLMPGLRRHSFLASADQIKSRDVFLMSKSNNPPNCHENHL